MKQDRKSTEMKRCRKKATTTKKSAQRLCGASEISKIFDCPVHRDSNYSTPTTTIATFAGMGPIHPQDTK